jgi:hypothetical protein
VAAGVPEPLAEPTRPVALPAVGEAEPGTLLAERHRRYVAGLAEREARAAAVREAVIAKGTAMLCAINRGEMDPRSINPDPPRWTSPARIPAEEPEDRDSLAWLKWHTAQNPQAPEEYAAQVAAYKRAQFEELTTGKVQPSTTHRLEINPRTGVHMSRTRRRGGPWSERCVIAVSRPAPRIPQAVLRPLRADRTRRESPARTVSRGGDSGDSSDSSDGEPKPPGVAPVGGLRHVSVAHDALIERPPPSSAPSSCCVGDTAISRRARSSSRC